MANLHDVLEALQQRHVDLADRMLATAEEMFNNGGAPAATLAEEILAVIAAFDAARVALTDELKAEGLELSPLDSLDQFGDAFATVEEVRARKDSFQLTRQNHLVALRFVAALRHRDEPSAELASDLESLRAAAEKLAGNVETTASEADLAALAPEIECLVAFRKLVETEDDDEREALREQLLTSFSKGLVRAAQYQRLVSVDDACEPVDTEQTDTEGESEDEPAPGLPEGRSPAPGPFAGTTRIRPTISSGFHSLPRPAAPSRDIRRKMERKLGLSPAKPPKPTNSTILESVVKAMPPSPPLPAPVLSAAPTSATPAPSAACDVTLEGVSPDLEAAVEADTAPDAGPESQESAQQAVRQSPPREAVLAPSLDRLPDFEAWRASFYLDAQAQVVAAPWKEAGFGKRLALAAEEALGDGRYAESLLIARAGAALGHPEVPLQADIESLIALLARPGQPASGLLLDRRERIRQAWGAETFEPTPAWRLAVVLEALRPNPDQPIAAAEAEMLVQAAGFTPGPVATFLTLALRWAADGGQPMEVLKTEPSGAPIRTRAELQVDVERAREALREERRRLYNEAGGRLITNHCAEAWREFMDEAGPVLDAVTQTADAPERLLQDIERLGQTYKRIADRRGAKKQDRSRMDRASKALLDGAREIVFAVRRARSTHANEPSALARADFKAACAGLGAAVEGGTVQDRWVLGLITTLTGPTATRVVSDEAELACLRGHAFWRRPALVATVPALTVGASSDAFRVDVRDVVRPVEAAAILLDEPGETAAQGPAGFPQHLLALKRPDLLLNLDGLDGSLAKKATDAFEEAQAKLHHHLAHLESLRQDLVHLAAAGPKDLTRILKEATRLVDDPETRDVPRGLLGAWLETSIEAARRHRDATTAAILEQASRTAPNDVAALKGAIDAGRYAEVHALRQGEQAAALDGHRSTRWRDEAHVLWPDEYEALRDHQGDAETLVTLWRQGLRDEEHNKVLRQAFVDLVFSQHALSKITSRKNEHWLLCRVIREWIGRDGLNPTFLPQLGKRVELIVATPSVAPDAPQFVLEAAGLASAKGKDHFVAILAPGVTDAIRRAFLTEIRRLELSGVALLDDLDLCRLLNPGGIRPNPMLGLMELVFEQATKWRAISPFEMPDGQHTKAEMYVGRKAEAQQLYSSASYSRVFSGRRLGKSALLRYVADTYDNKELPSRQQTLRVLYVPAVGINEEAGIVDAIADAMRDQLEYRERPTGSARDRLRALIRGYLEANPKASLLVFFDEADSFVEAQIDDYDQNHEGGLTWLMRSELESIGGGSEVPRVRFVFSGYRTTNRAEGAWANWGDVLRLRPLEAQEAISLISGPLERMGIRIGEQGPDIAYRCGYQPAVLLKFGQQLVEHLDAVTPPSQREGLRVTPEHVAVVIAMQAVQQEIRTVVSNNFQGNRLGKIVFAALLRAFGRHAPNTALDDAPSYVLRELAEVAPQFAFPAAAGPAHDQVHHLLRDLVSRSLLEAVNTETSSFRLTFPHHLQILLHDDPATTITKEVAALGTNQLEAKRVVRSLLAPTALENLRVALAVGRDVGVRAAVACGHWPTGLDHQSGGLGYALAFDGDDRITMGTGVRAKEAAARERLMALQVRPDDAAGLLRTRDEAAAVPLFVGGADLLRWCYKQRRNDRKSANATNGDFEVATLGRLGHDQLDWWFGRPRGLEFAGALPYRDFLDRTSGIPLLVGWLDDILMKEVRAAGETVDERAVKRALEAFDREFPARAKQLRNPEEPTIRLMERELEIFHLVAVASEHFGDAYAEALDDWATYVADVPGAPTYRGLAHGSDDDDALALLMGLGLLPAAEQPRGRRVLDRVAALEPGDAAYKLLRCLLA